MNYTFRDPKQYIPFIEEDPWVREKFEAELAAGGLTSLMPPEAYVNPNYVWESDWLAKE